MVVLVKTDADGARQAQAQGRVTEVKALAVEALEQGFDQGCVDELVRPEFLVVPVPVAQPLTVVLGR